MDTVIFTDQQGQEHEVEPMNFDAAYESGLRPRDAKEMGLFEAFKTGLKAGVQPAAEIAAGVTGFPFAAEQPTTEQELEESQAWAEHPWAYGAGKALPSAAAIAGSALAGRGAMKAGGKAVEKAKPYVEPSIEAGKAAYRQTMASPNVPDVMGVGKAAAGGVSAVRAAVKQVPETMQEAADLAKLERRVPMAEAGAVNPQTPRLFLGQEVLEPGATPEKAAIAERAATLGAGNIRIDPLQQALEMGTTRRQTARGFLPEQAAEEIAPGLKDTLGALTRGKGEKYVNLFEQAKKEYSPEIGLQLPQRMNQHIQEAKNTIGVSGPALKALESAQQILGEGPSALGLTPGKYYKERPDEKAPFEFVEVGTAGSESSAQQYERIKVAREVVKSELRKIEKSQDPNINTRASVQVLKNAAADLDGVMKSIPAQAKADELYSQAKQVRDVFFGATEQGKGTERKIDIPTIKKLFGNNDKAYRFQETIEKMRAFLDKYGNDIVPEKATEMRKVVDRFDELRKVAEDKRLLEGMRQAQGPTSPAMERTESLRQAKGLPSDIFRSPASALTAADEFVASRTKQYFGKGQKFETLDQDDKNRLIRLLVWRQQNPDASMLDENSMFNKIMKAKKGK